MTAVTPTYTQADLDADIAGITDGIESVRAHIGRIKNPANWAQVQHLHPGVDPIDYMRSHVPWLNKNVQAGVALVNSGTTTQRDAARLTGVSRNTIAAKRLAQSSANPPATATTIATGKTAPGPKVGTPRTLPSGAVAPVIAIPPTIPAQAEFVPASPTDLPPGFTLHYVAVSPGGRYRTPMCATKAEAAAKAVKEYNRVVRAANTVNSQRQGGLAPTSPNP